MSLHSMMSLLGSLGLFLCGMKATSEGLERFAGDKLRVMLGQMTRNRVLGVLCGALSTAVMQSSSASTVMVVGFVNAHLLSLKQAVSLIMGANIGTTVTSLLLSVKLDWGAIFAFAGLVLSILPRKYAKGRQLGQIAMGLGVLFAGMNGMAGAVAPLRESCVFREAVRGMSHPALCVVMGVLIAAVLQSSSAGVGMLQALAGEGVIPLRIAMFVLFGQNIGTCATSLLSSAGASVAAKRAAVVHLLFNVVGVIVFFPLSLVFPLDAWMEALLPNSTRLQLAGVHILFNVGAAGLLLPAPSVLERAACWLVQDRENDMARMRPSRFGHRLPLPPSVSRARLLREVHRMGDMARDNLTAALSVASYWDEARAREITQGKTALDVLHQELTAALTSAASAPSDEDNRMTERLLRALDHWKHVGEMSIDIAKAGKEQAAGQSVPSSRDKNALDALSAMAASALDAAQTLVAKKSNGATQSARIRHGGIG